MRFYLCPALMDATVFLVAFAVMYRAGEQRLSAAQCAWLAGLFQLTYMVMSLAAGWRLSARNARALALAGTAGCTALGILSLAPLPFGWLLAAYGAFGAALALFFNAFQAVLRDSVPAEAIGRALGRYTLAWSSGCAAGILSSGFAYRLGMPVLAGLSLLAGAVSMALLLRHPAAPAPAADAGAAPPPTEPAPPGTRPVDPAYVGVGWLFILGAMFVQRPIHAYFPALCAKAGVSAWVTGLPLFLQMAIQGAAGYALIRGRRLFYRPGPILAATALAAGLALAMWRSSALPVWFAGISLLGLYTGFAFFCGVYYASHSGRRALNIGINEFLVGLGSFAAVFAANGAIARGGRDEDLCLAVIAALMLIGGAQLAVAVLGRTRLGGRCLAWISRLTRRRPAL